MEIKTLDLTYFKNYPDKEITECFKIEATNGQFISTAESCILNKDDDRDSFVIKTTVITKHKKNKTFIHTLIPDRSVKDTFDQCSKLIRTLSVSSTLHELCRIIKYIHKHPRRQINVLGWTYLITIKEIRE